MWVLGPVGVGQVEGMPVLNQYEGWPARKFPNPLGTAFRHSPFPAWMTSPFIVFCLFGLSLVSTLQEFFLRSQIRARSSMHGL